MKEIEIIPPARRKMARRCRRILRKEKLIENTI